MLTNEDLERRARISKAEGAKHFMQRPMTRMLLSMVPPMEHQEGLTALIEEAYAAGFDAGAGALLSSVVEAMIMSGPPRKP